MKIIHYSGFQYFFMDNWKEICNMYFKLCSNFELAISWPSGVVLWQYMRRDYGQLVPKTTRTQDNSYPRQLVPRTRYNDITVLNQHLNPKHLATVEILSSGGLSAYTNLCGGTYKWSFLCWLTLSCITNRYYVSEKWMLPIWVLQI